MRKYRATYWANNQIEEATQKQFKSTPKFIVETEQTT